MKEPTRLFQPGAFHANYSMIVEDTTLEQVLSAAYWVHVFNTLRVNDVVEVVDAGGGFDVDIRLVQKRPGEMKWRVIREAKIEVAVPSVKAVEDQFEVKSNGRAGGFRVVEKATGKTVSDGFDKAGAEEERARLEETRKAA